MTENKSQSHLGIRGEANVGAGKLEGRHYLLQQESDCLQSIFCCFCESENEFAISEADPNYNVASKKGTIKETSDCLSRVFCVCNRPFEAKMRLFNQDIAVAQRSCKCCLEYMPCLENEVIVKNSGGRHLGTLRVGCWCWSGNFFGCADAQIQILDQNQEVIYTLQGNYCQKSILCPCFRCCYCPNIQYIIFDNLNLKVGKVTNIYSGCCSEIFSRADKFGVQFPVKANQDQKILITYAVMYLDYLRYETPYACLGIR